MTMYHTDIVIGFEIGKASKDDIDAFRGPGVEVLDYEQLVADFEAKLVTQLRKFGADAEYLEMWVPDENRVKSILNMVEAAEAYGRDTIAVRVAADTMPQDRIDELVRQIGNLGSVAVERSQDKVLITVTKIGMQ
jgi:hypothetical protein